MDALQHFLESARNTFDAFAQQVFLRRNCMPPQS